MYGARVEVFNNGSLVFRNVQKSTEGQYLCQAHNGIGAGLSKVVYLTVNGESEGVCVRALPNWNKDSLEC